MEGDARAGHLKRAFDQDGAAVLDGVARSERCAKAVGRRLP